MIKAMLAVGWLFSPFALFIAAAAVIEFVKPVTRAFDRFCDRWLP